MLTPAPVPAVQVARLNDCGGHVEFALEAHFDGAPVPPWLGTEQRVSALLEILSSETITAKEAKKALLASRGNIDGAHAHSPTFKHVPSETRAV